MWYAGLNTNHLKYHRYADWLKLEERVVRFHETGKIKTILANNHIW